LSPTANWPEVFYNGKKWRFVMRVCVYGAASSDIDQAYLKQGYILGQALAKRGWGLVFGGGTTGMMGSVVKGIESKNGQSIGVAPHFFKQDGVLHERCTQFIYTDTMRERKQTMENLSDAFIMVPGGIGTMEEFFEVLTLKQLHQLDKPICIYNIEGYFDDLHAFLEKMVQEKFLNPDGLALFLISDSIEEILDYIQANTKKEEAK
jgi:uncharacterized protein (TIGR00730 family)